MGLEADCDGDRLVGGEGERPLEEGSEWDTRDPEVVTEGEAERDGGGEVPRERSGEGDADLEAEGDMGRDDAWLGEMWDWPEAEGAEEGVWAERGERLGLM